MDFARLTTGARRERHHMLGCPVDDADEGLAFVLHCRETHCFLYFGQVVGSPASIQAA